MQQQWHKALANRRRALEIREKVSDTCGQTTVWAGLALLTVQMELAQWAEAEQLFDRLQACQLPSYEEQMAEMRAAVAAAKK